MTEPLTPEALDTIEAGKAEAERIWPIGREYSPNQLGAVFSVKELDAYCVSAFTRGVLFAFAQEQAELRRLRTENETANYQLEISRSLKGQYKQIADDRMRALESQQARINAALEACKTGNPFIMSGTVRAALTGEATE